MTAVGGIVDVAIVNGEPVYRAALEFICSNAHRLRLAGSFTTGETALAQIPRRAPDVAVIDLDLPDMGGIAVVRRLSCDPASTTRTLVLARDHDGAAVYRALAAGAAGYLAKSFVDCDALSGAIVAIAEGSTIVSPELMRFVAAEIRLHAATHEVGLTEREQDVLRLVARGCSTSTIAGALFVSPSTVKTHLRNLYEKLGVSDRAAAVAQGMKHGLVTEV